MYLCKKNWKIYKSPELESAPKNIYNFSLNEKEFKFVDYDEWKFIPLVRKFLEDFHFRIFSIKEKIRIWIWWFGLLLLVILVFSFKTIISQNNLLVTEISSLRTKTQNLATIDFSKQEVLNNALLEKLWIKYDKKEVKQWIMTAEQAKSVIDWIKK